MLSLSTHVWLELIKKATYHWDQKVCVSGSSRIREDKNTTQVTFSYWILVYRTHWKLHPPFLLSYKYGGAYYWIISFISPPFSLWSGQGKQQWQNCSSPFRVACDEACSGSVLQGKGSSINEGAECVQSEKTMQFLHQQLLATICLPPCSPVCWCITGQ